MRGKRKSTSTMQRALNGIALTTEMPQADRCCSSSLVANGACRACWGPASFSEPGKAIDKYCVCCRQPWEQGERRVEFLSSSRSLLGEFLRTWGTKTLRFDRLIECAISHTVSSIF